MMSVERVTIFWVVNASSGEKSCLQFSIPTGSGAGGEEVLRAEQPLSHFRDSYGAASVALVWFSIALSFALKPDIFDVIKNGMRTSALSNTEYCRLCSLFQDSTILVLLL